MPENSLYLPEGLRYCSGYTTSDLEQAMENHAILEEIPILCDSNHSLHFRFGSISALMKREDAIAPWISGANRDISAISRVGKPTCFTVKTLSYSTSGSLTAVLSRRAAQEQAMNYFLSNLRPGSVITGRILRTESYGAFVDIGCGIVGLLPIERISISRLNHPSERFFIGQKILAAILDINPEQFRIILTHRELLGTWSENASAFHIGETVRGIVRSIKSYGAFVELTPNLSGLAEPRKDLSVGDHVSVYIKNIRPETMKIKLQIIDRLESNTLPQPINYKISEGILESWNYSPALCQKPAVFTNFTASDF